MNTGKSFNVLTLGLERWGPAFGRKHKGPKRSPMETQATSVSDQQRAAQGEKYGQAQGTLNQFEGPVQDSPFYKALKTAGTDSTANAYQSAKSNVRARAKSAGFGTSPVGEGATAGIESEEAKAQARVPGEALVEATGPALSAAGKTADMGTSLGSTGSQYFGDASSMENAYQQAAAARSAAMWGALGQVGSAATGAFCVAEGTPVLINSIAAVLVDELHAGDAVLGIGGWPLKVIEVTTADSPVLQVVTKSGLKLLCSPDHTMLRPVGGYVRAKDALNEEVLTAEGPSVVAEVSDQGIMRVVCLQLNGSHTYCAGGIWSEE